MFDDKRKFLEHAFNLLTELYPEDNGWAILKGSETKTYKIEFLLERREDKIRYRKVVKAILEAEPRELDIKKLNGAARRLSGRYARVDEKIFLINGNGAPEGPEYNGFSFVSIHDKKP